MTTQREGMRKLRAVSDASVYEEVVVEGWGLSGSLEIIAVKRVMDKEKEEF